MNFKQPCVKNCKGSDSGGSIRAPAHNCGIVGLKPTSGRLPLLGQACDGGLEGIPGGAVNSSGFMVRTVEDLYTIHQIVLGQYFELQQRHLLSFCNRIINLQVI